MMSARGVTVQIPVHAGNFLSSLELGLTSCSDGRFLVGTESGHHRPLRILRFKMSVESSRASYLMPIKVGMSGPSTRIPLQVVSNLPRKKGMLSILPRLPVSNSHSFRFMS